MQRTATQRTPAAPLLLAFTLLLALMLAGCSPVPPDATDEGDLEGIEEPEVQVEPALPAPAEDLSYLDGVWVVQATLMEIDQGAMRESADQPSQRWDCAVSEGSMTLITDSHTYVGPIEPELDNGWVFTAVAEFVDEDGESWSNDIEIHGKRTGETMFAGGMEITVDSAEQGHRYTAIWDLEARRQ